MIRQAGYPTVADDLDQDLVGEKVLEVESTLKAMASAAAKLGFGAVTYAGGCAEPGQPLKCVHPYNHRQWVRGAWPWSSRMSSLDQTGAEKR